MMWRAFVSYAGNLRPTRQPAIRIKDLAQHVGARAPPAELDHHITIGQDIGGQLLPQISTP